MRTGACLQPGGGEGVEASMSTLEAPWRAVLDADGCPYTVHEHAAAHSVAERQSLPFRWSQAVKTLAFTAPDNPLLLVALRAQDRVDFARLAAVLGTSRSRLRTADAALLAAEGRPDPGRYRSGLRHALGSGRLGRAVLVCRLGPAPVDVRRRGRHRPDRPRAHRRRHPPLTPPGPGRPPPSRTEPLPDGAKVFNTAGAILMATWTGVRTVGITDSTDWAPPVWAGARTDGRRRARRRDQRNQLFGRRSCRARNTLPLPRALVEMATTAPPRGLGSCLRPPDGVAAEWGRDADRCVPGTSTAGQFQSRRVRCGRGGTAGRRGHRAGT
ncbi:hypothetical protein D1J60_35755 (plasmid) [Streptomyces sp. W1SF4]|nr:hypothetical protein D1J60_35755 [Streptomyces sp. W1SF4]